MKRPPVIDYCSTSGSKWRSDWRAINRMASACLLIASLSCSLLAVVSLATGYRYLHLFTVRSLPIGWPYPFHMGEFTYWDPRTPAIHWEFADIEFAVLWSVSLVPFYVIVPYWVPAIAFLGVWRVHRWFEDFDRDVPRGDCVLKKGS